MPEVPLLGGALDHRQDGGRRKPGRSRKGEEQAKESGRLERQLTMSFPQMLPHLPRACDVNAKGRTTS